MCTAATCMNQRTHSIHMCVTCLCVCAPVAVVDGGSGQRQHQPPAAGATEVGDLVLGLLRELAGAGAGQARDIQAAEREGAGVTCLLAPSPINQSGECHVLFQWW
jgi:hypothetical protein